MPSPAVLPEPTLIFSAPSGWNQVALFVSVFANKIRALERTLQLERSSGSGCAEKEWLLSR
jgi:hypothetical protein